MSLTLGLAHRSAHEKLAIVTKEEKSEVQDARVTTEDDSDSAPPPGLPVQWKEQSGGEATVV